jgi:hypothetical protein
MVLNNITNFFMNNIAHLLRGLEQSLGMPLWAVLTILVGSLSLLFFYGLFVPLSMIKIKKNMNNIIHVLSTLSKEVQINSQKQGSKYRWKK